MSPLTPGPWKAAISSYANAPAIIYAGARRPWVNADGTIDMHGSTWIAEVLVDESPRHEEMLANARAVAAAPELLAAAELEEDAAALTVAAIEGNMPAVVALVEKHPGLLDQGMLAETAAWILGEEATTKRRAAIARARS